MDKYDVLGRIGEGAHGIVLKARQHQTGEVLAMKKVGLKRLNEGLPIQAWREIKCLQELNHQNVISLREVFPYSAGFIMVFDYMATDLGQVLRDTENPLGPPEIKGFLLQLLYGLAYIHKLSIMHRDLKPANLLIGYQGNLKIADFGLARLFFTGENREYSHQVATRWYRAPELLYGARNYDESVDLWAVGCIFGEMFTLKPVFPSDSDIEQLVCVFRLLGSPTSETWPTMKALPDYHKITFPQYDPKPLEEILPNATKSAVKLLSKFLRYNGKDRISARSALVDPYIIMEPLPEKKTFTKDMIKRQKIRKAADDRERMDKYNNRSNDYHQPK